MATLESVAYGLEKLLEAVGQISAEQKKQHETLVQLQPRLVAVETRSRGSSRAASPPPLLVPSPQACPAPDDHKHHTFNDHDLFTTAIDLLNPPAPAAHAPSNKDKH